MSPMAFCQPSLPITGRVGSSVFVRWYSAFTCARWAGSCSRSGTPQLSFNGTQVMMQGWLKSRRTASAHSRNSRSAARSSNWKALAASAPTGTPTRRPPAGARPRAEQPFGGPLVELEGIGRLGPDEHAQAVTPVEKPRVLDLLVDAHAVEAEFPDEFDLPPDGLVARRRQMRLRPVILGQDQAQE